jgi:hypothetical protein
VTDLVSGENLIVYFASMPLKKQNRAIATVEK